MQEPQDPSVPQDSKPNKVVKLVFEEYSDEELGVEGVHALKVWIEFEGRPITQKVLMGDDRTVAEIWAAEMFDIVRSIMKQRAQELGGMQISQPNKEEMN